jgi:hypothetical protein
VAPIPVSKKSIYLLALSCLLAGLVWPGMPVEDSDNNNAYLGNVQNFPFSETELLFSETELP